jgi:hypothetical protein
MMLKCPTGEPCNNPHCDDLNCNRRDGPFTPPHPLPETLVELGRLREFAHRIGLCTCSEGRCHRSDYQCLAREALTGVKNWAPGGEP